MSTGRVPTTANSPLTAKGDLFTYDTNQARLAVGSNGDTLLADSSTSTGLRWGNNLGFTAGKNKIINGDFGIWQRGTSFSSSVYTADRWFSDFAGGVGSVTQQTFTPGSAPIAGYEGTFFLRRDVTTGAQFSSLLQRIEDVRTFANQTITVSFWAKGTNPTGDFRVNYVQSYGSGGSAQTAASAQSLTVTANWTRYSFTFSVPSIAGKTVGTGSYAFVSIYQALANTSASTLDIWGVQVEAGSVATAFQTATGTLAGELAACQRYYYRITAPTSATYYAGLGMAYSTTQAKIQIPFPVAMRTRPTAVEQSGTAADYGTLRANTAIDNLTTVLTYDNPTSNWQGSVVTTSANLVAGNATSLIFNNSNAYVGWSAEL